MSQGSTLGSMRYILRQLEVLTSRVRGTVAALETAEKTGEKLKLPEAAT